MKIRRTLVAALLGVLLMPILATAVSAKPQFRVESICLVDAKTIRIETTIPQGAPGGPPYTIDLSWEADFTPLFSSVTYPGPGKYRVDGQPPDFTDNGTEWVYARIHGASVKDKGYIDDHEAPCRGGPTPTPTPTLFPPEPVPTATLPLPSESIFPGIVLAPRCAPSPDRRAFTLTVNQPFDAAHNDVEFSWSSSFGTIVRTIEVPSTGAYNFTVPAADAVRLYGRYTHEPTSVSSTRANHQLCQDARPTGGIGLGTETNRPHITPPPTSTIDQLPPASTDGLIPVLVALFAIVVGTLFTLRKVR